MKVLAILRIIFGLLPAIRQGILAAEKAIPGKGKGEMKLVMVREIIEEILKITGNSTISSIIPNVINRIITRIVTEFNKDGWPEPDEVPELGEVVPVEPPKKRR